LWVTDIPTAGDPAVEQIETDGGLVSSRGDYHLSSPSWLAVDPSDNVWVSDSSGHVVRFDSAGDPVDSWMMPNENGSPAGVGVGADGSVYLVWNRGSMAPPCVGVFDSTGSLLTWFGVGSAAGALTEPFGLTVAADGTVYVGDYGQRQVKSFAKIAPEADFAAPPTVGAGGTSFTIGTTQTVAWSMTAPVTDGHFNVVANDAAHKTSYLIESIAADGSADYSWDWPIAQPAGTGWHITVEWDKAGGGTVTSADSATFALRGPALAIATPSSGVFASGTSTTVGWTLGEAVSSGSFRVWLKDTTSGAWVRVTPKATPVPAAAGKTSYSVPWNVTQPLGTYRLWVYYYGPDGTTVISTAASSGTLTIAAKPTPTIVSPNSGVFTSSSATTVEWSMSAPVGKGFFRVWLRNTVTNAWVRITPSASPVPAVPGETAYRVPWNVTQPIGAYKLWVFYYGPDGTTAVSTAVSSGTLTIGPKPVPTVVSPNSGSLTRGSGTTVEWSMNTAVATGSFRVWLKNTVTNAWVRVTPTANPVLAAPGETAYSVTWFVTQPAATYKLWVYYYAADGTVSTTDQSSGTITLL
jgi:hypothetical protein